METDLKTIKKLSEIKNDENWKFRSFLKAYDISIEKLDEIVHELYQQVSKEIDCRTCGNCCKIVSPTLQNKDVKKLSSALDITFSDFTTRYLKLEKNGYSFKNLPCPFLKENICTCYDSRPKDCVSFPHLHKKEFIFRLWGVVENYSFCPIVYNVYEELKAKLWHRVEIEDEFDCFEYE